ncbi:endo alpha-1,4 polygalactosaminidase [Luteimicrobium sp. NPDC057192]|uniref:endo alpha-1,4 polygalactosaminidase n=1 Tax=Luteimicrobium sp. NPDC057192 TaxID=3346042 RepID=UPI00363D4BFB
MRHGIAAFVVTAALALGGCGTVADRAPSTPAIALPPTSGVFDYQLGGTSPTVTVDGSTTRVDVVERDATARPLTGAYNVCYVNGFQTQPDERAQWQAHPDLLLHRDDGSLVVDPDWPGEYVLDPSTAAQRRGILAILGPVVRGCAADGFDAVELDNLDTWTRFDAVDEAGALALARAYADLAHGAGLAVAQKNAAELAPAARRLGFDFAVTEECAAYDECDAYTAVYGRHVLEIEYPDSLHDAGLTFADVCRSTDRAPLTILRDRELVAPGEPGYRYDAC